MNVIVKTGGIVTLPDEVLEELDLEPGSEVAFSRSTHGGFMVEKVEPGQRPSREQARDRIRAAAARAKAAEVPQFANMSTDEFMAIIRG